MNDKLNEFLKAKGPTEELLKKHVVENASNIVADKILNGKKDMKGCYNYIKSEARKQATSGVAMISDAEVFAMAIEYFNNDDIKVEQPMVKAKTTHTNGKVTKEEYAAAKEELAERAKKNVERAETRLVKPKKLADVIKDMTPDEKLDYIIKNKKAKKVKKEEPENQVSLFDF